jgi:hypothetical protein
MCVGDSVSFLKGKNKHQKSSQATFQVMAVRVSEMTLGFMSCAPQMKKDRNVIMPESWHTQVSPTADGTRSRYFYKDCCDEHQLQQEVGLEIDKEFDEAMRLQVGYNLERV